MIRYPNQTELSSFKVQVALLFNCFSGSETLKCLSRVHYQHHTTLFFLACQQPRHDKVNAQLPNSNIRMTSSSDTFRQQTHIRPHLHGYQTTYTSLKCLNYNRHVHSHQSKTRNLCLQTHKSDMLTRVCCTDPSPDTSGT